MIQPGRKYSALDNYRYGFNGKENDNEVKGEGNQQDYGMRIYDPRLGRFLSVDPLTKDYPMLTPYQFASDNPIALIDVDGLEGAPPKPKENGSNENQTITTNNGAPICPSDATGCDPDSEDFFQATTWHYHKGGMGTGKFKTGPDGKLTEIMTQSGWYTTGEYFKILGGTTEGRSLLESLEKISKIFESGKLILETGAVVKDLEKYKKAFEEGKFVATYNGEQQMWKFAFNGSQYVESESVLLAKANTLSKVGALEVIEGVSEKVNILCMGIAVFNVGNDIYEKGTVTVEHSIDLVMSGIAFIPPYGWVISGAWFLGKMIPWKQEFEQLAKHPSWWAPIMPTNFFRLFKF
jgi:RHS repeat-associated protein